ncbi:glycoside hydrolase domain-containing protein [Petrimonas sp.]|uniref:glycoside hydrolase domain-containing protein n=1 Tax=Petrimonas sp. TaxID=2023866 RepID=UPI0030D1FD4E
MYKYKVSDIPWPEKFGNHRAVIHVTKPANAVLLNFQWRRSDANVAERMFLIVNAETGDTIKNIQRINVNNDICNIKFGPVTKKGRYYFYYLPYIVQTGHGFYGRNYYPKENVPNVTWLKSLSKKIPVAKIVEIQSRTAFDIVNIHYKVLTNKYQLK